MRIISLFLLFPGFLYLTRGLLSLDSIGKAPGVSYPYNDGETLRFFILGDSGTGDWNQNLVAHLMEKRCEEVENLNAILLLGDNIYPEGAQSKKDPLFHSRVEEPYQKKCLKKAKIHPILGNHDYKGNPHAQVAYSELNSQWDMPHRFYTINFGSFLQILAYDSSYASFCFSPEHCSLDFLLDGMKNRSNYQWLFVLSHHPLTSASSKEEEHYSGDTLLNQLLRPLACPSVDAWFAGHSHHLEQRQIDHCSCHFFISGGGGGHLNNPHLDQKESLYIEREFGFLEIEVQQDQFISRFFTKEGLRFERIQKKELSKR